MLMPPFLSLNDVCQQGNEMKLLPPPPSHGPIVPKNEEAVAPSVPESGFDDLELDDWLCNYLHVPFKTGVAYSEMMIACGFPSSAHLTPSRANEWESQQEFFLAKGMKRGHFARLLAAATGEQEALGSVARKELSGMQ